MSGKILVPLDGSKLAEVALPYAEELATRLGYGITLINVRLPAEDPYYPALKSYLQSMAEKTERNIRASLAKKKRKASEIKSAAVGSTILVGHPAEMVLDYADDERVNLIVMATHGRTGIKRWTLGSIADKVVRASTHPVLLVRANTDTQKKAELDNILVPLDGSKQSEAVLSYIKNIASKLKSRVILLHVIAQPYHVYTGSEGVVGVPYTKEELKMMKDGAKDYLERVGGAFLKKGINTSTRVRVGGAAEEIIRLAEGPSIDIVAMSTCGRSGFKRWDHGSVADKVLRAGNSPLLLVRGPAGKQKSQVQKTAPAVETVDSLIGNLASSDGVLRVKARRSLVKMGRQAVDAVVEALQSKNHWVRWEAAKTLAQIGDPAAAQALVNALTDNEFDVRWLAAEGLIHIGAKAMKPLMKALIERSDSVWLREGTHHVLHDMDRGDLDTILRPVLEALEDVEPSLEVVAVAEAALNVIRQD